MPNLEMRLVWASSSIFKEMPLELQTVFLKKYNLKKFLRNKKNLLSNVFDDSPTQSSHSLAVFSSFLVLGTHRSGQTGLAVDVVPQQGLVHRVRQGRQLDPVVVV